MPDTMISSSSLTELSTSRRFKNSAMTVAVYSAFAVALIPLIWLSITVVTRGASTTGTTAYPSRSWPRTDSGSTATVRPRPMS